MGAALRSLQVMSDEEIPGRLRELRESHGLSQRRVADLSGLSLSTVCGLEQVGGASGVSMRTLWKWLRAVGCEGSVLVRQSAPVDRQASSGGSGS